MSAKAEHGLHRAAVAVSYLAVCARMENKVASAASVAGSKVAFSYAYGIMFHVLCIGTHGNVAKVRELYLNFR